MYIIYHYSKCKKSRESLQYLESLKIDFKIRDYFKDKLTIKEFSSLLVKMNLEAKDLLRKQEALYKHKYKSQKISNGDLIDIMINNPQLIERPIIETDNVAILGQPLENIDKLIINK